MADVTCPKSPIPAASKSATILPEHVLRSYELVLVTPCAAHDAQSAFRWGMGARIHDRALLRDVYIGVEALRHTFDLLVNHAAEWVAKHIDFVPARSPQVVKGREELWLSLGIEEETASVLAKTFGVPLF